MIKPIAFLVEKLQLLDSKVLQKVGLAFVFCSFLSIAAVHFLFVWSIKNAIVDIDTLNAKRKAVERLLVRKSFVVMQKNKLEAIVAKEPYFRIKEYCSHIINMLKLNNKIKSNPNESIPQEIPLINNYSELLIAGSLSGLSTKEVVNFLINMESNPRVYLKEIKVLNLSDQGLMVNYTIAALKMQ